MATGRPSHSTAAPACRKSPSPAEVEPIGDDGRGAAQALLEVLQAEKPAIVRNVTIFDVYQGPNLEAPGLKSLAFRVVMQDTERTLTDAEADAARDQLLALLGRKFSATLRK